ncbi:predicted protein [Chaetoceros tenuissimus]|uniref:Uncharacterized protein n=1 Tax=Chaetoceros tenuissimus TaxID=426638 RepID=A0AAD3D6C3_9STRA|nr:predicted protein [Chaetoceros tenuissimus]
MQTVQESTIGDFVSSLNTIYDEQTEHSIVSNSLHIESQQAITNTKVPSYVFGLEDATSTPCLSLKVTRQRMYSRRIAANHEVLQELMSRTLNSQSPSKACLTMLRNLIASFGRLIEIDLEQQLFHLIQKFELEHDSGENMRTIKRESILKALESYADSCHQSPAIPIKAKSSFSISSLESESEDDPIQLHVEYKVQIVVRINTDLTLHKSTLSTNGTMSLKRQLPPSKNEFDSMELTLDMDNLYSSLRKKSKYISKRIINGIVGYNIFPKKPSVQSNKRVVSNSTDDAVHLSLRDPPSPLVQNNDETYTQSTVSTFEDGSFYDARRKVIDLYKNQKSSLSNLSTPSSLKKEDKKSGSLVKRGRILGMKSLFSSRKDNSRCNVDSRDGC